MRYVIGPSKAEYRLLGQVGLCRLSEARLRSLLERFLVSGKGGAWEPLGTENVRIPEVLKPNISESRKF